MFENFLYYIIAILIYSTHQPVDPPNPSPMEDLGLFCGLLLMFCIATWMRFKKLENQISSTPVTRLDRRFHSTLTQQSIMALIVFAVDVYGLNLNGWLRRSFLFTSLPTLDALIFLLLFIGYLSLVWTLAYGPYQKIYKTGLSRSDYLRSHLSFAVPVLLPWLLLSVSADLLLFVPFEDFKGFFLSDEGQIAYFMFFLFLIAVFGPALIQRSWGCRPLRSGLTRQRIESICKKANLRFKNIMVWPLFGGHMITAGVMGLVRGFRYILVTPALIRHLEPEQLDAVIAHEIGHVKKHHLLFYLFFFAGYLILLFPALDLIAFLTIYAQATLDPVRMNEPANATLTSMGFGFSLILLFFGYFRYVFGYFMRNFERQADLFAYGLTGSAGPLISTFETITAATGQDPQRPNWHHFSIQERIDYLKRCETDPIWINRHHAKVKKSLVIYAVAILMIGWAGYGIHYGEMGQTLNTRLLKTTLEKQIKIDSNKPELYQALGDLYYQEKNYAKTINSYQRALALDPHQVQVLNNLAWLYATCEDSGLRNPQKALALARQAVAVSEKPHILDTLAEAYYVNGDFKAAVQVGKKALAAANTDTDYYRRQIRRFNAALEKSQKIRKPSNP